MNWFESYVQQSIVFTSWKKVEGKVCQVLKQNLEKKLMDPVQRQLLFEILGNDFVTKYFSSYTNTPAILDNVRSEEKEKKMVEMKALVASTIDSAIQKKGSKTDVKLQSDISAFSGDIKKMIDENFEEQTSGKSKKKVKTDLPEKYLCELISHEPNVINFLLTPLQNQVVVLSDTLRKEIWPLCIVSKEKSKNVRNVAKVKEKFTQLYYKFMDSDDSDERTVSSAVNKMYKDTLAWKSLNSDEHVRSTIIILNMCNAYGRKFQENYVPYAAAVQQMYLKNSKSANEEDFSNAAILTEKVLRLCALNNDRASKITKQVLEELKESDKEMLAHINPTTDNNSSTGEVTENIKKDNEPLSIISKWMLSGYASFLKPKCLYFIWDQLFYHRWENKIFCDVTIALLGLLKPWLMHAKNQNEILKVFNDEPSYFYLLDLRKALIHVQKKRKFSEIPQMNRNVIIGEAKPPPEPVVPPPRVPTPPPPTPPKPKTPPKRFIPWVPYDKTKAKDVKITKSKLDFPFDLYIDSVRFVPDNATFVKVTGKVLNMYLGQRKSIKFQAFPELDSKWRYPDFKFKQVINKESIPMNPDVVVMIRVYTIEKHSKKNYVLGSCLFGPFSNKQGKQAALRTGGHQIRVRHGIPDPDFTLEHMLASHMDDNPVIPGVTILLRVLPHSNEYVPAPEYETNVYRSELAKPNGSEEKLYKHYQEGKNFSQSLRDVVLLQIGQASANDDTLTMHMQQQLQKEGSGVEDFPFERYVDYDKNHGIQILADKASGLPIFLEGRYLQCLVQIFPGEDTKFGNGKNQVASFVTEDLELESPQRAPDWSDPPKRVTPEYDDRAFVLVSLYGLRPKYDASRQKILDKEGKDPVFNLQQAVAWSAATIFEKGAVFAGIHHIPLLKGRPPDDIIEKLSYLPLDYLCKKFKNEVKLFETASIELSIWDGHFSNNESPPLPVHTKLLSISSNPQKYIKAAEHRVGATVIDLLKQGMSNPSDFSTHKKKIIQLLKTIFKDNLDIALANSGYNSLV